MTVDLGVRYEARPPDGWDEFITSTPGGTFCHLERWGELFSHVFGHEPVYAWIEGDSGIQAVLPLVRMPTMVRGRALISLPYLNYGGPVGSAEGRAALAKWALAEGARRGDRMIEVRCMEPVPGEWPKGRVKTTVLLDLPEEPEALWDSFKSKLRSQIRRPMKEEMEVRFGAEVRGDFYSIFSRNMRDLGTPVLPRRFFDAVAERFPSEATFAVVYHQGEAVAGGGGFLFNGEFEITWASSLREHNRLAPNMLLYWSLMERMIQEGATRFNFGRCTPGGGTHRFKLQWGGRDVPLAWIGAPPAAEADDTDGGAGFAQRAWTRLPLPVANVVGPVLAGRIPNF